MKAYTNEDVAISFSGSDGSTLRQILIKFLDAVDYSFTSYPQFKDLELAVRNEILSFGINLPQEWETIVRTTSALAGMAYFKHPIEIQLSVAVWNVLSFVHVVLLTHPGAS